MKRIILHSLFYTQHRKQKTNINKTVVNPPFLKYLNPSLDIFIQNHIFIIFNCAKKYPINLQQCYVHENFF